MKKCLWMMILILPAGLLGQGVDTKDTRLLSQPAIGKDHIAFVYAGDLWIADLDGKSVRRLTTDQGVESNPHFSPDSSVIAFSAQYDGNTDVYSIPVAGGVPTRLTWHPDADLVQGFTPDGSAVLFTSPDWKKNLGRPGGHSRVSSPDGRRFRHGPKSGDLDRRRLGRRK